MTSRRIYFANEENEKIDKSIANPGKLSLWIGLLFYNKSLRLPFLLQHFENHTSPAGFVSLNMDRLIFMVLLRKSTAEAAVNTQVNFLEKKFWTRAKRIHQR